VREIEQGQVLNGGNDRHVRSRAAMTDIRPPVARSGPRRRPRKLDRVALGRPGAAMSNTTTTYLSIADNLSRYQKLEAQQPAVKTATAYYRANIGKVRTIDAFVGDYRLLSYALQAYGLGDQIHNTALIKKVLEQGTSNPKALANTLPNPAWKAFAKAFNFSAAGAAAPTSSASVATATGNYVEQQLEADQGANNVGVELALYFKRVAPSITSTYGILADKNLLQVVQTVFGLAPTSSAGQIDKEAKAIQKLVPVADLRDPVKLNKLVARFTAAYDAKYGPASGATTSLTVNNGNTTSNVSAAASVLSGVVASTSLALAQTSTYRPLISPALLANLKIGG
jgi:hypothetical protein